MSIRASRVAPLGLLATLVCCGCINRPGMNLACQWPPESAFRANLANRNDVRHLVRDIEVADELVIRYRDEMGGRRPRPRLGIQFRTGSGPRPKQEYAAQCRASLVHAIATTHAISDADVIALRPLLERRGLDLPVTLPVLALYAWLSFVAIRRVNARFDAGEATARWVAVLVVGFGVSAAAVLAGGVWSGIVEIVYVGNDHLSNRATHIVWPSRMPVALVAGILAFIVIARAVERRSVTDLPS